jgi:hypothetical protein
LATLRDGIGYPQDSHERFQSNSSPFLELCLAQGHPTISTDIVGCPLYAFPRYVRAVLYDYRFTDRASRKETGAWWRRAALGLYCPVLTLVNAEERRGSHDYHY